jgi:hypothetical protein
LLQYQHSTGAEAVGKEFSETRSVWMEQELPECRPLEADAQAAVCVIGGGSPV